MGTAGWGRHLPGPGPQAAGHCRQAPHLLRPRGLLTVGGVALLRLVAAAPLLPLAPAIVACSSSGSSCLGPCTAAVHRAQGR
jgi:hypothetical protein